jgi:hypothetical protein
MQMHILMVSQVPALDNGELVWALIACETVLRDLGEVALADGIREYYLYQASTAKTVFYTGAGNVRWVSHIRNNTAEPSSDNYLGPSYPGDPYEGAFFFWAFFVVVDNLVYIYVYMHVLANIQMPCTSLMHSGELFTWFMDLYCTWDSPAEREEPWMAKRAMLKAVNYTTSTGRNITVQRGYWYSAHENWKIAFLPFDAIPITKSIFQNCERARTAYSVDNHVAGMYACVNDVARGPGPIPDYVSDVGIPPLAYLQNVSWRFDLVGLLFIIITVSVKRGL